MIQSARLFGLVFVIGLVAGCGEAQAVQPSSGTGGEGQSAPTSTPASEVGIVTTPSPTEAGQDQEPRGDARQEVNQLALGTLYLQETKYAITPAQAATLLPLWQGLQSALQSETTAQGEAGDLDLLLDQIEGAMTPEQNDVLASMSQDELLAWAQQQGLTRALGEGRGQFGNPPTPGAEGDQPARTPGARGTPQGGGPGPGGMGFAMVDNVINALQQLAGSQ